MLLPSAGRFRAGEGRGKSTRCAVPILLYSLSLVLRAINHGAGVRVAASRKLEHELGIPQSQTPVDEFQYLTRIQYLAPSNGLWGEHEGELSTLLYQAVARCRYDNALTINWNTVDYILFFTGDVDVTPNLNEISDYKYVSRTELQRMFEDPGMIIPSRFLSLGPFSNNCSDFIHSVVQTYCAGLSLWMVG